MKRYVLSFMAIFSFFTMFFAPFLAITYFPKYLVLEIILSMINAVCISAVFVDISIGIMSIMLAMKDVYKESVKNMQSWIIIAFFTSIVQYIAFLFLAIR